MRSDKITVRGMTCGHCVSRVEKALQAVPGTIGAYVDLTEGIAEVDYDEDAVSIDQLVAAVKENGYEAETSG